MIVEKPWGREVIWALTERYVGKVLEVRAGQSLSRQFHRIKDETMCLLSGEAVLELGRPDDVEVEVEVVRMVPGKSIRITPMTVHRLRAITDASIMEVSTPELDDVVRLDDAYGRA